MAMPWARAGYPVLLLGTCNHCGKAYTVFYQHRRGVVNFFKNYLIFGKIINYGEQSIQ
jgi:hypothetical protein